MWSWWSSSIFNSNVYSSPFSSKSFSSQFSIFSSYWNLSLLLNWPEYQMNTRWSNWIENQNGSWFTSYSQKPNQVPRTTISSSLALINSPKHFLCFQEINHQSQRGGIFIITEHHVATVSHLMIKNLTMADSGRFSCSTSAKSRTNVELHVINGAIFFLDWF